MLKSRLIPVLLLKDGLLVRSERFRHHQVIGNPIHEVQRFSQWQVDELIYLDITRSDSYDLQRDDHRIKGLTERFDILDAVSAQCFMPLAWGGRITTLDEAREAIRRGADKVTLNSAAVRDPSLITEIAKVFGSQAVIVSMDVREIGQGAWEVFVDGGRTTTGRNVAAWTREIEARGAGEVLLQSIDRDGTGGGYDLALINAVAAVTSLPVIACAGVGRYEDFAEGIRAGASAVAAANIWHFKELVDLGAKRTMAKAGIDVRL